MYTLRFISTSRLLWIDLGSAQRHRLDESKHLRRLPHPLLEVQPLLDGHGVGLGDDGDDVDRVAQVLHELKVQLPETTAREREGRRERASE